MTITTAGLIAQRMRASGPALPRSPSTPSRGITTIRHPNETNINLQMQRSVATLNESFRPTNTMKCHAPKIEEYFEFCDAVYGDAPYRHVLNAENVLRFMFYQTFRPLKKRGGKGGTATPKFNYADYKSVTAHFDGEPRSPGAADNPMPVQAAQPISWSTFDQYRQVLRKIYKHQKMEGVNTRHWDDIWQQGCEALETQVKTRVPFIKKATYQEKVSAEFAPYTIVERYPERLNRSCGMMQ
jgi:hypothetical protein